MKSSDIDQEYITRRTTITTEMADDIAALNQERQEQQEERRVEREAQANQGSSALHTRSKAPVIAGLEPPADSDGPSKPPIC